MVEAGALLCCSVGAAAILRVATLAALSKFARMTAALGGRRLRSCSRASSSMAETADVICGLTSLAGRRGSERPSTIAVALVNASTGTTPVMR